MKLKSLIKTLEDAELQIISLLNEGDFKRHVVLDLGYIQNAIKYLKNFRFRNGIAIRAFDHVLEIKTHARQPWSHFRIHRHDMHKHIVWGRISIIVGQPQLEEISLCAECGSPDAHEISAGDEGLTYCPDCETIEGGYTHMTLEEWESHEIQ